MTGLQKFIMELQQISDGTEVWNSTYEFAKTIGIKKERQRILKIVESFANQFCKCDSCNTARAIAEKINGE